MDLPTSRCPWLLCGRSNRAKDRDTAISIVVPAACDFGLLRDIEFRSPATLRPSYSTNGSVKDAINTQTCSWPHATFRWRPGLVFRHNLRCSEYWETEMLRRTLIAFTTVVALG